MKFILIIMLTFIMSNCTGKQGIMGPKGDTDTLLIKDTLIIKDSTNRPIYLTEGQLTNSKWRDDVKQWRCDIDNKNNNDSSNYTTLFCISYDKIAWNTPDVNNVIWDNHDVIFIDNTKAFTNWYYRIIIIY